MTTATATGRTRRRAKRKQVRDDWRKVKTLSDRARFNLRDYWRYPLAFFHDALGVDQLWQGQLKIIESVRVNRETGVAAAHGTGKTFCVAGLALCWLYSHKPAQVIIAGPTHRQARSQLWAELRTMYENARVDFGGELQVTQLIIEPLWFAMIVSTSRAKNFSGIHSPSLLMVFDEGSGIPRDVWTERLGSMTGEHVRFISMDNPVSLQDTFGQFWSGLPAEARVQLSAYDMLKWQDRHGYIPGAVTRPWVESMERWKGTAIWNSKVMGKFTSEDADAVAVPYKWLRACVDAIPMDRSNSDRSIGLDVARSGKAETVLAKRFGPCIAPLVAYRGHDLMDTCGRVGLAAAEMADGLEWAARRLPVYIDSVGLGAGVFDRLRELKYNAVACSGGESAREKTRFVNQTVEDWWRVREMAQRTYEASQTGDESGLCLSIPDDAMLMAQFSTRRWRVQSEKRIELETKEAMAAPGRGLPSPDRADAVALSLHGSGRKQVSISQARVDKRGGFKSRTRPHSEAAKEWEDHITEGDDA
jgi:hypothetical protein